jgi:hypothetical protein
MVIISGSMDTERISEHRDEKDSEPSWRERLIRTANGLRSGLRIESAGMVEEELLWLKARPSLSEINGVVEEAPKDEFMDSEERSLVRVLREALTRTSELESKIGEFLPCENVKRLRVVWGKVVEQGVIGMQGEALAKTLLGAEERLKKRMEAPWAPQLRKMTLEELRTLAESWDKGIYPQDDYLFGLLHRHLPVLQDILREAPKTRKLSAGLPEEQLNHWLQSLHDLKLDLDVAANIEGLLRVRAALKHIVALVQKTEGGVRNNNLMAKIVEEITSWNRKKLTEEEFTKLREEVGVIRNNEHLIDAKDYDWVQFQNKIAGYEWRQEVRLTLENSPTENDVQALLRKAPKDLKVQKCYEWNLLVEKAKDIEWFDDKQIMDKIMYFLDEVISGENREVLQKFISNANISVAGEEAIKKLKAFERIVQCKCSDKIESLSELEDLVKEMLDSKFYNTKTFAYFDNIHRTIQTIHNYSATITSFHQKEVENPLPDHTVPTLESLIKNDKLVSTDVKNVANDFSKLPNKLTSSSLADFEVINEELTNLNRFLMEVQDKASQQNKKMFGVYSGKKLQAAQEELDLMKTSYSEFALREPSFEEILETMEILCKACRLLDSDCAPEQRDIASWDGALADVKRVWKEEFPNVIIKELEGPLLEAKAFLRATNQIKNGAEGEKRTMTLPDVRLLLQNRLEKPGKVFMQDSIDFLVKTINKAQEIEELMQQERVSLIDLKNALTFMQNISIQFDGKLEICQNKIEMAESLREKVKSTKDEKLEKEFESLTEEYNKLNISIPEVEEIFNSVQDCRNTRSHAERLLASEDYSLEDMIEMKNQLMKMKYFRSANLIGRVLSKLFYKMREVYESNQQDGGFTIEYKDLCKLINDAQSVLTRKKCKEDMKAELKEKTGYVNQIFKDANEYLSKHVYTLDIKQLDEAKLDEVFRGFVKITSQIQEYRRKLEDKDDLPNGDPTVPGRSKSKTNQELPGLAGTMANELISQDIRNNFVRIWKDHLSANKFFSTEPKEISQTAKNLEKEVHQKYGHKLQDYEKHCEEISRLFREIIPYTSLSSQIKAKKFSLKAIRDLFGKTSGEIRSINYTLSRNTHPTQSVQIASLPNLTSEPSPPIESLTQFSATANLLLNPHKETASQPLERHKDPLYQTDRPYPLLSAVSTQDPPRGKKANSAGCTDDDAEAADSGSGQGVGEYKFYRIYSGDVLLQSSEPSATRIEKLQFLTCSAASLISKFSHIPQNLTLSTKVQRSTFSWYISKVMRDLDSKYRLLAGYLSPQTTSTAPLHSNSLGQYNSSLDRLKKLMTDKDIVCSNGYTDLCKIFVFPRDFLAKEWLEDIEIVTMHKDAEIIYFLVYKVTSQGRPSTEPPIVPEPLPLSSSKAYKLIFNNDKVRDHHISTEFLREHRSKQSSKQEVSAGVPSTLAPIIDPLPAVQSASRRNVLDLVKSADEGFNKILKSYEKPFANPNMRDNNFAPTGLAKNSRPHQRDRERERNTDTEKDRERDLVAMFASDKIERDRDREKERDRERERERSFVFNPTCRQNLPRPDWPPKDPTSHHQERERPDTNYENDLLGALQDIKMNSRNFINKNMHKSHNTSYAETSASNSILPQSYNPNHTSVSGISKLLTKRPPITHQLSNNSASQGSLITPSLQSSLGASLAHQANHYTERERGGYSANNILGTGIHSNPLADISTSPTYEKKSFLQNAINSIQTPSMPGSNLLSQDRGYYDKPKKPSNVQGAPLVPSLASTLPSGLLTASYPRQDSLNSNSYFKKKGQIPGTTGYTGSGSGGGNGTNPSLSVDYIKNQFF